MNTIRHHFARAFLCALGTLCALGVPTGSAAAQDLHPSRRLSPIGIAKTHLGDTYVKVTYGRPYIRGRDVFGANTDSATFLVPFGVLWRTGANEATEITLTGPLTVAGRPLPAGTYSIFTEPGPSRWRVHFSPILGLDGTGRIGPDGAFTPNAYDPARDVLVVEVPSSTLDDDVDPLTLDFEETTTGADLVLRWERTEVRIPMARPRT
jgi:hypothetical protein